MKPEAGAEGLRWLRQAEHHLDDAEYNLLAGEAGRRGDGSSAESALGGRPRNRQATIAGSTRMTA
jgi:hypothetical protein